MATIRPDDFSVALSDILGEFAGDVAAGVSKAVEDTGKQALAEVRAKSPKDTGQYRKGWRKKVTSGGVNGSSTSVTIYNATDGSLVHLLEKGHQKAGGGRVEGTPHVAPAVELAERVLPELVEKAIKEASET